MKEYMFLGIMCLIVIGAVGVAFNEAGKIETEPYQAVALDIFKHGVAEPNDNYQAELEEARQAYLDSEENLSLVKQNAERDIAETARRAEITCLAVNIYFEARDQDEEGQRGVAAVTINRVNSPVYPDTVCDVVFQGCQFAWTCDEDITGLDIVNLPDTDRQAYYTALAMAEIFYEVCIEYPHETECKALDPTGGAMHFHALYSKPYWANPEHEFVHTATLGDHAFYRAPES